MPKIQAFRGLRYNPAQVGSLSNTIAPPYDVVDSELHQELYAKSPYNFIRIELPQSEPGDADSDVAYSRAARLLRQWVRDGVMQHEPDPAIYVYHQVFDFEGRTYTRRGFMSRVELVRFGEGNIYPHEETHSKAKEDRLKLTRACSANTSQIYGLYPDPLNEAQNLLEAFVADKAAIEAIDHLGVTHRMWPVTEHGLIGQVGTLLEDKPMFVADGHHRYETACNYRDELAAEAGGQLPAEHPANCVLAMVMSMDDPGLIVLPTHRLIHGVEAMDSQELASKLGDVFDCEVVGEEPAAAQSTWKHIEELDDQGAFGIYTAKDKKWTLVTATHKTAIKMAEVAGEQSDDWRGLGVAILHGLILDELLGMKGHEKPTYVHQVDEVQQGLDGKLEGGLEYQLAALVMPATVEDIRRVSLHRERMPAKSTYFFPKLVSGLVVNPLDCS